jgi:proline iminopeptidase
MDMKIPLVNLGVHTMNAALQLDSLIPREGYIPVGNAELYYREIGKGQPIIILHGGPDFDHAYLLPDLDRLSDSFRLIYYDQRGRGKSADHVQSGDVSIQSEIADLDSVRKYFQLKSVAILGHSWGALLALEYAIRHPICMSKLIIMNTAPVSHDDYLLLRKIRRDKTPVDIKELKKWSSDVRYQAGDPDAVADYYRVHFRATIRQPEHLEHVIRSLRSSFTKEGILKAREIEKRLYDETWYVNEYNLLPKLKGLHIPTLVIHGDYDFVPVECSEHVAQAMPGARFAVLKDTGHFSYVESPNEVRKEIDDFFPGT